MFNPKTLKQFQHSIYASPVSKIDILKEEFNKMKGKAPIYENPRLASTMLAKNKKVSNLSNLSKRVNKIETLPVKNRFKDFQPPSVIGNKIQKPSSKDNNLLFASSDVAKMPHELKV